LLFFGRVLWKRSEKGENENERERTARKEREKGEKEESRKNTNNAASLSHFQRLKLTGSALVASAPAATRAKMTAPLLLLLLLLWLSGGEEEGEKEEDEKEPPLPPPRTSIAVFYEPHFNALVGPVVGGGGKDVEAKRYGAHLEAKVLSNFEL